MSKQHDEIIETEIEQTSKNVKYAIYFFCISTLLQLLTMTLYSFNNYIDRKEQAKQYQLNRQEQSKQYQLNRQFEILKMKYAAQDVKYKEIQYPLIIVRADLEDIYTICKKSPINVKNIDKLKIVESQLEKNRINLIQSAGNLRIMFSPNIHTLFVNYTAQVEKVVQSIRENGACPTYLPTPTYWQNGYHIINDALQDEVEQTEANINKTF